MSGVTPAPNPFAPPKSFFMTSGHYRMAHPRCWEWLSIIKQVVQKKNVPDPENPPKSMHGRVGSLYFDQNPSWFPSKMHGFRWIFDAFWWIFEEFLWKFACQLWRALKKVLLLWITSIFFWALYRYNASFWARWRALTPMSEFWLWFGSDFDTWISTYCKFLYGWELQNIVKKIKRTASTPKQIRIRWCAFGNSPPDWPPEEVGSYFFFRGRSIGERHPV